MMLRGTRQGSERDKPDETFIGNERDVKPHGEKKGRGYAHKQKVLSLRDRDTKQKRSMIVALGDELASSFAIDARSPWTEAR